VLATEHALDRVWAVRSATGRASSPRACGRSSCWSGLQLLGGWFVSHEVRNATPAYGTFALVLGLLVWINLGAALTVLSAELNVVWERRLWPRSLLGAGREEDERVMTPEGRRPLARRKEV
jgi:uncharacterized BrkB/YihY/UPF0761 family membrane protein